MTEDRAVSQPQHDACRDRPAADCERPIDSTLPSPNFFVVGAVKAGTTSLHAYLRQHPEVFMSDFKEPHYFSCFEVRPEFDNFMPVVRDSATYQRLFLGSEHFRAIGDASPSYLYDSGSAARIKSAIPNAKIIISLRDPVQRAHSHYLMELRQGRETRSFSEALRADQAREEKGWGVSFQYIEQGLYADHVERYLDEFGQSKVLIILFEDLIRDTAAVMSQVAEFLEVDAASFPASTFDKVHNPFERSRGPLARMVLRLRPLRLFARRWVPQGLRRLVRDRFLFASGSKPVLDERTRKAFAQYFVSDVERLEQLLHRKLDTLRASW